jgi:hypothetical protein
MSKFNFSAHALIGQLYVASVMKKFGSNTSMSREFMINSPEMLLLFMSDKEQKFETKEKALNAYLDYSGPDKEMYLIFAKAALEARDGNTIPEYDDMMQEADSFMSAAGITGLFD